MRQNISRRTMISGVAGAMALLGTSCTPAPSEDAHASTQQGPRPLEVLDMHADTIDQLGMAAHTPYSGFNDKFTGTLAATNAQVSADRMGDARWVQCYSIWIPDNEGDDKGDVPAIAWYREAVTWFRSQMETCAGRIAQARSFSDIPSILDEGKVAAILTVENAACLEEGIEVVDEFASDGVLIAGITWNFKNALGAGNQYPDVGLTDLGRDYLAALEAHGILADVSHLNDVGFWEVERIATKPYVATHSNARAVCDHPRNLTDEMFSAIVARGGLVGLNLNQGFVHEGGGAYTFDELAAHVERWLDLGGEDVVALGSDRDGAWLPSWVADCSSQPYLFERFSERLGETVARRLFFGNAMRLFSSLG